MNKLWIFWETIAHPPKADILARRELEKAKRNYLDHQTHLEYYTSQVNFERQRIARLESYLTCQ